jgi:hypothetical protein
MEVELVINVVELQRMCGTTICGRTTVVDVAQRWTERVSVMAEYIEREALDRAILRNAKHFKDKSDLDQIGIIVMAIPAADVADVVRCKDCKQWRRNIGLIDSPNGICFYHYIDTNGNDFCSYGEKKDGKGDGE